MTAVEHPDTTPIPVHSIHDALRAMLAHVTHVAPHPSAESAHKMRKEMKRIRAALRLLRESLGNTWYQQTNKQVRDAARPLAPIRDATVLLRSAKQLRRPNDTQRDKKYARRLQAQLERELASAERHHRASELKRSAAQLREIEAPLSLKRAVEPDLPAAIAGIGKIYKNGRKALRQAQDWPNDDRLHEWRKQVKYLSSQLEIIQLVFRIERKSIQRRAQDLAEYLGSDHDLALLSFKIDTLPSDQHSPKLSKAREKLQRRLRKERKRLQRKASRLGTKLYRRPSRKFARRLSHGLRY